MRKIALVLAIALILTTGTAFASDPRPASGLGIGIVSGGSNGWGNRGGSGNFGWNYGLALYAADIYWGVNFRINDNWFRVAASGDFRTLVGGNLAGPIGWYIDLGLFGGIGIWNPDVGDGWLDIDFGARLPIGLSFNFDIIDIWLAFVPRIGVGFHTGPGDTLFPGGGWGPEFGIRLWL